MTREDESNNVDPQDTTRRKWWKPVVGVLAFASVGFLVWSVFSASPPELLQRARAEFKKGKFQDAERLAARVVEASYRVDEAALLAARAAMKQDRVQPAVEYYQLVSDGGGATSVRARCEAGLLLLQRLRKPFLAEQQFRSAIAIHPSNVVANEQLAFLLGTCGFSRDAEPFRLRLIALESFEPIHLYLLGLGELVIENPGELNEFKAKAPNDPRVLYGVARQAVEDNQAGLAIATLRKVIEQQPDLAAPQMALGELLFSAEERRQFIEWHRSLPSQLDHPQLWSLRARWAMQNSLQAEATRCFWEAARRDPNSESVHYQLGRLLVDRGDEKEAKPFLERSRSLGEYLDATRIAWKGQDTSDIQHAAQLAESLGLLWEAYGWYRLTQKHFPHVRWAVDAVRRLKPRLASLSFKRHIPAANIANQIDLSQLPLPRLSDPSPKRGETPEFAINKDPAHVRFSDKAGDVGIHFAYRNRPPDVPATRRMYEFNGGGVAVVDYDLDGWPDIYFAQGTDWPPNREQHSHLDSLYRNTGEGRFVEVSGVARVAENGFSSGVTAGDFNSDGFPDLYVANVDGNRFFENNGDGTFTDITAATSTAGADWSTSCLLTDLSGDGLPDLYVVNYLEGADVFARVCPDGNGNVRSCIPRDFEAASDRYYVNLGDGRFEDRTQTAGVYVPNGKGLGIATVVTAGSKRVSLFVANDTVPNFWFVNEPTGSVERAGLSEQALVAGLGVNEDGLPEACMGVAVGDANGDGRMDLFVTNFYDESNTLLLQESNSLFVDATRQSGLHSPSLKMLGFGTQFVDGELDGQLDLLVANGHIDDLSDIGVPFKMPAQYFSNRGDGRFEAVAAPTAGRYFESNRLGRAMARCDWNRDGAEDVVITHLDGPAALLTNETSNVGRSLVVKLVGTTSNRDAIGTTVTVHAGDTPLVRQLTAGDGFQASNQRQLTFGLGRQSQVGRIVVQWPSGVKQEIEDVPAGIELLIVEGRTHFPLPKTDSTGR